MIRLAITCLWYCVTSDKEQSLERTFLEVRIKSRASRDVCTQAGETDYTLVPIFLSFIIFSWGFYCMEDNDSACILFSNTFTLLNCFSCPPPFKVSCTSSRQLSPLPLLYVMIMLSARIYTFILSKPLYFLYFLSLGYLIFSLTPKHGLCCICMEREGRILYLEYCLFFN